MGPLGESVFENNPFEVSNEKAEIDLAHLESLRRRFPFWTGGLDA
jgi:hypothetical protein